LRSNFVATHFDEAENHAQQPGNPGNVGVGLQVTARHDINRMNQEQISGSAYITDKSRVLDYTTHFMPALLRLFMDTSPADLLSRLGYGSAE